MKNILTLTPLILFGLLTVLLVTGRIRFGHGLGDVIYYPLIIIGLVLSIINYYKRKNTKLDFKYISFVILFAFATSIFLEMTIWRGAEYRWNGDIIEPTRNTIEKRRQRLY